MKHYNGFMKAYIQIYTRYEQTLTRAACSGMSFKPFSKEHWRNALPGLRQYTLS